LILTRPHKTSQGHNTRERQTVVPEGTGRMADAVCDRLSTLAGTLRLRVKTPPGEAKTSCPSPLGKGRQALATRHLASVVPPNYLRATGTGDAPPGFTRGVLLSVWDDLDGIREARSRNCHQRRVATSTGGAVPRAITKPLATRQDLFPSTPFGTVRVTSPVSRLIPPPA
jgi:hypothetical protein